MHVHLPQIGRIADGADAWEPCLELQDCPEIPSLTLPCHFEHKVLKMFLLMLPGRAPESLRLQRVFV